MNEFKIKIRCTHKSELNYLGKKITQTQIYNGIRNRDIFDNIEESYIDRIIILYKHLKKTTTKTFECFTSSLLTEAEFVKFIYTMHLNGFQSDRFDNKGQIKDEIIQFINIQTKEVIYNYSFNEIRPILMLNPKIKRIKNKSSYTSQVLFTKSNK